VIVFVSRHFVAFACLAYAVAWGERIVELWRQDGPLWAERSNNLTQYFVNYVDHGFAKRALIGTLLRPVLNAVEQPELWAFWAMVGLNLAGFAGLLWLVRRCLPHDAGGGLPAILRAAFAIGSVGVVQIAHDYGRFDLINYGVALLALWCVLRGRVVPAGLACVAGVLIHEAFVIYAAPLVVAAARAGLPPERRVRAAGVVALAAGIAGLAILFCGSSETAAGLQIGTGAYVWQRGLIEINWTLPWYQAAILAGYWLILLALLAKSRAAPAGRHDLTLLAALSPLALNLLGIDHGRWLGIGFLVAIAALVLRNRLAGAAWPDLSRSQKRLAALLALPLGPHGLTGAWTWVF